MKDHKCKVKLEYAWRGFEADVALNLLRLLVEKGVITEKEINEHAELHCLGDKPRYRLKEPEESEES